MEHGAVRNLEQIQEVDAGGRTSRLFALLLVGLGGAAIVFASMSLSGRKSHGPPVADPLGDLVAQKGKAAPAKPDLSPRDARSLLTPILEALSQRRQSQRKDAESVPEVLAERSIVDHLVEITVRGGDDAHVHVQRARADGQLYTGNLRRLRTRMRAHNTYLTAANSSATPILCCERHISEDVIQQSGQALVKHEQGVDVGQIVTPFSSNEHTQTCARGAHRSLASCGTKQRWPCGNAIN